MQKRYILPTLILVLLLLAVNTQVSSANHFFGPHWKNTNITVVDATNYPEDLQHAVAAWDVSDAFTLTIEPGPCRKQQGKIVVCSSANFEGGPTVGAFTEYDTLHYRWWDGVTALHFKWVLSKAAEDSVFVAYDWHRKYVFCHEIGHGLGLNHSPNQPGCMGTGSSDVQSRSLPDAHDYEQLTALYNHTH